MSSVTNSSLSGFISPTWLLISILLGWYIVSSVRAYWRLRHIKGPWIAGWSNIWLVNAAMSKKYHLRLAEVSEKYGTKTSGIASLAKELTDQARLLALVQTLYLHMTPI
jgi:hypothetical protein